MRLYLAAVLLVVGSAGIAGAQSTGRLEVSVAGSWLPLSGGNATIGASSAAGLTGRISYRLPVVEIVTLEGVYTRTSQDDDPYNRVPGLTFAGVQARVGSRPAPADRFAVFALGGLERMQVDAEEVVCDPPLCMWEGGGRFHDARLTAGVAGAGVSWLLGTRLLIRSDMRLHVPFGASPALESSGSSRLELALGFGVRL